MENFTNYDTCKKKKKLNFCELNPKVSKETQKMLKILDLREALPQFENI